LDVVLWAWTPGDGCTPVPMPETRFLAKVKEWAAKGAAGKKIYQHLSAESENRTQTVGIFGEEMEYFTGGSAVLKFGSEWIFDY
jgi:hypothetical protein